MKLSDFISLIPYRGKSLDPIDGEYGLELETETKDLCDYPPNFFRDTFEEDGCIRYSFPELPSWVGHTDNSLRNFGHEFVFKTPYNFEKALDAIDEWAEVVKNIKFIKKAPATSTHVHVNLANEEPIVVANFLVLYTLFESVLVDYSGSNRRSNLFALPIRVAEATYTNIYHFFEGMSEANIQKMRFNVNSVKYAAGNLEPLTRIGSFEIRCFRGETDPSELKRWLKIINQILVFARISGMTPTKIISEYREKGVEFLDIVFDEVASHIRSVVEDIEVLIDRNLWYAARLSLSVDWETLDVKMVEYIEKNKNKPPVTIEEMKKYLLKLGIKAIGYNATQIEQWYNHYKLQEEAQQELEAIAAIYNDPPILGAIPDPHYGDDDEF